ncbi:tRNA (guanine(10)-N(2))-dimethyltransferase [Candidatus Micrarchaeota archaeon]|nr:tRNA (guanine(10)-N(2))-dimethyltransferase [Candidatus Micrarchaeota archaeon]
MEEEEIKFEAKEIFYNTQMRFCRSISSLCVGAIGEHLDVLDGFCASGIRGIRYARENKNVTKVTSLDYSKKATNQTSKNLKKNKTKGTVVCEDFNKFLINEENGFNFVEIDPFGTPVPYLYSTFYSMQDKKGFYLSLTATDTAVLCGHEGRACLKNYHSKSLNNEFTHENGLRILIKRVLETAGEFNFGIEPFFSLSDRHYLKVIIKCEKSAVKADECWRKIGFTSFCPSCGWRKNWKRVVNSCEKCKKQTDYGGPLWLGELQNKKIIGTMAKLNSKRDYADKKEIEKVLNLINGEIGFSAYYYNVHELAKKENWKQLPTIEELLEKLRKKGFNAVRTHFSPIGIKTNAEDLSILRY